MTINNPVNPVSGATVPWSQVRDTVSPNIADIIDANFNTVANSINIQRTSDISISGIGTYVTFNGASKAGTTWSETKWLPCGVDSVRIALFNDALAADFATYNANGGVKVTVQATESASLINPTLSAVLQAMIPVTFGGATSPVYSANPAADQTAATFAPVMIWSDWIPVNNTGVNSPSYLIVRVYYPTGVTGNCGYFASVQLGGRVAKIQALGANAFIGAGATDHTTDTAWSGSPGTSALPTVAQFATRRKVTSIVQYGDSTRQGYYSDGIVESVERYGIAKTLAGTPISVTNRSITSATSPQYFAHFMADVAKGETWDVIVWQHCTVNDVASAANSQIQINQTHEVLRQAKKMGAKVLIDGPYPFVAGTPTGAQTTAYLNARTFCLAMDAPVGYIKSVTYDGLCITVPSAQWLASYNYTGDGLHPNELAMNNYILPQKTAALDALLTAL